MKFTEYFLYRSRKLDRVWIKPEWIEYVLLHPEHETVQADGRIRRWAKIKEANNRYLRVVILADGETVHNAFFDRSFTTL
jgi:hypothetical protein